MSTVRITTLGGDEWIVTLAGLRQRLPDPRATLKVLEGLIKAREAHITLKDNQVATVTWDEPQASLPMLTDQRPGEREYVVDAQLSFELPASIHCRARSASEATTLSKAALMGNERAPVDFKVEIHQDDVETFLNNLEIAETGRSPGFGVSHVFVTGVQERLQIGDGS